MKSYKCLQCGLTNWTTVESCKRCQSPNPSFADDPNTQAAETFNNRSFSAGEFRAESNAFNHNAPPPPNIYGNRVGNASQNYQSRNSGNSRTENTHSRPFRRTLPNDITEKLAKCEKDINNAWQAGRAWSILIGVFIFLAGGLVFFFAGKAGGVIGFVLILFMIVLAGGTYALSYGIKQKSRACVIILLSFTSLGLLANLFTIVMTGKVENIISFIFSILLTYYFALGTQGMFGYYQLKDQYPDLIN